MHSFIRRYNNTILTKHTNQNRAANDTRTCNCRQADECPISVNCLTMCVVYQAGVISDNGETKAYLGVTSNELKSQYRNHLKSFRHQKYSNDTELSKYVWGLKGQNRRFNITWSIIMNNMFMVLQVIVLWLYMYMSYTFCVIYFITKIYLSTKIYFIGDGVGVG